jgi:hypothetical protein
MEHDSLRTDLVAEIQSLRQEVAALRAEVQQQPTLGFNNGREYIIIERDKTALWHRFENEEPTPIHFKVLKGYFTRVAHVEKEYPKLHVFIAADQEYVLVTGFETHFAREILAAIASLSPQDLADPVIIKPDIGSDSGESKRHKPVFCNVIHQGRVVKPGALRDLDIQQLFQRACLVLGQVDWKQVCRELQITPEQLKTMAEQLHLPVGKLTPPQTAQLYRAVHETYSHSR